MVKSEEVERVKQVVVAKAYLDPTFHQQFTLKPVETVLNTAKNEAVEMRHEEAENIVHDVKSVIAPFVGIEVKKLVTDLTDRIKIGFESILQMSKILFYLGIGIIIGAFLLDIYGIFRELNWQQYIASTGVLGAIGLGTIITSFIKGSFEKIKNSIGDLVQINVLFFGYADQLSLLMQQSLNADYELSEKIIDKISSIVTETVKNIQTYCEISPSGS